MATIIRAKSQDLDAVWTLVQRTVAHMNALGNPQWGADYPTRALYQGDIDRGELYAVVEGSQIAGVACINGVESPEYAPIPWRVVGPALSIHRMAVDPSAQRRGVAHALFAHAEALAHQGGIPTLHLDTYCQNDRMQTLLKQLGYQPVGEIYLHDRTLPYPCFEKVL